MINIEELIHTILQYSMFGLGIIVFIVLFFITAGYGRYKSKKWGYSINPKLGWFLMEFPSPVIVILIFFLSQKEQTIVSWIFLFIWELHYVQRAFIYPFLIRSTKKMPLVVISMGFMFNIINAYLQGRFIFELRDPLPNQWLTDIRFLGGFALFLFGYIINLQSDYILRHLRKFGESDYKIPFGGFFEYVSCPNYLGEILEWVGWAILTWSLSGVLFAFWTGANLIPRAVKHHKWYHENYPEYPKNRKIIFPKIL